MPTSEDAAARRRTVTATSSEPGRFEFTNGAVAVQSSRDGDQGVRAVDLLLASLAMCVAGTVRAYARASWRRRSRECECRGHGRRGRFTNAARHGDPRDPSRGRRD